MKISLCMITKDEGQFLHQCLKSVHPYVDEILIVDTGSSDHTCSIALEYGATIYHHPWQMNFAEARNFGLERATGDWILYLDGDEFLENGELLRSLVEDADSNTDGFLFHILNYSDEDMSHIERSFSIRLFRNKPGLRFSGALHEQLPIQANSAAMTDLVIHHYGYLPSISQAKEKSKRNLEILLKEHKNNPDDPFLLYNLGCEYARLYQLDKAIAYYKEALQRLHRSAGYESRLYKMLALSLLATKNLEECFSYLAEGIKKFPNYPDLHYVFGLCHEAKGEYEKAAADFLKCLNLHDQVFQGPNLFALEEGVTSYKSLTCLGRIYEKMNMPQEALMAYSRAIQSSSSFKEPYVRIKNWFENDPQKIKRHFEQKVFEDGGNMGERLRYAHPYFAMGDYPICIALLHHDKREGNDPRACLILGISYFMAGKPDQALTCLTKIKKGTEEFSQSLPYQVSCHWIAGNTARAKRLLSSSPAPGETCLRAVQVLLEFVAKRVEEGRSKYPHALGLKEQLEHIQKLADLSLKPEGVHHE